MKILENKEIKKVMLICLIIIIITAIFVVVTLKIQTNNYKKQVNTKIAEIIGTIIEKYPQIDDSEIIEILNNESFSKEGIELLNKYGIEKDVNAIYNLNKSEKEILKVGVLSFIIGSIAIVLVFIAYLIYRHKKLDELSKYIEKIINKDYSLNIEENSEDELSKLKNQLYKVTIILKEEAENAKKQKTSLADSVSDISHQLKTPLTSTMILLDNLSESKNMEESTRNRFINEISRQIEGMNWLVTSLLKLSRLDAGVITYSKEKIKLRKLIEEVIENLEILAEIKNVNFEIQENEEIITNRDYKWNKEAIQNIVKNAIEHTKENSKITITIKENSIYTEIRIKDEGVGINNKDLKHIFERFYKSKQSSENSIGIGLSLAKTIIEQQNGYITVETEGNNGTTFIVKYIK